MISIKLAVVCVYSQKKIMPNVDSVFLASSPAWPMRKFRFQEKASFFPAEKTFVPDAQRAEATTHGVSIIFLPPRIQLLVICNRVCN